MRSVLDLADRAFPNPSAKTFMDDSSLQPSPVSSAWSEALDSWTRFALRDLEAELEAHLGGSDPNAARLLDRAGQDLAELGRRIQDAVQAGDAHLDLSAAAGIFNRLTRAGRRRFADLVDLGALPLAVQWPVGWHARLLRDALPPDGTETPPTRPATPRPD